MRCAEVKRETKQENKKKQKAENKLKAKAVMYLFVILGVFFAITYRNAKIDENYLDENEVGLIFGNDSTVLDSITGIDILRNKKDTSLLGSSHIFRSMNSTVTMNLSTIFKIKGGWNYEKT